MFVVKAVKRENPGVVQGGCREDHGISVTFGLRTRQLRRIGLDDPLKSITILQLRMQDCKRTGTELITARIM